MQRLPIAAAPRLTEGQESAGIAVIGEGAVVGGCTAASRSVVEGDTHSRAVMQLSNTQTRLLCDDNRTKRTITGLSSLFIFIVFLR